MPKNLTEHFTLDELVASQTAVRMGINNSPTPDIEKNLQLVANTLEEVRKLLGGVPILISSGYRSPDVNKAVGGSNTSAHVYGLAVDFTAPKFGSVLDTARKIADSGIVFDQIIHEYGSWVHLGLAAAGKTPRRQKLTIFKGTGYMEGLLPEPATAK